ncbi:MAG: hypothetical protein HY951_12295 [Bacteroidia bacterium]|nr:hypothetical protein [Bacteroidia bacterium]
MKKIALLTLALFLGTFVFTSCQKDCKSCKTVTTNNSDGSQVQAGSDAEYCDTALDEKESQEPVNDGSTTTKWVCE